MPKMVDLGRKDSFPTAVKESDRNRIVYPSIHLRNPIPDELFSKEIGSEIKMEVVAKVTDKGIDEGEKRKEKTMRLELRKMGILKNNSLKEEMRKRS